MPSDERSSGASADPIADLIEGARRIREQTGETRPFGISVHRVVVSAMAEWFTHAIKRAEKFLRKPLLSGHYEKRQRQKRTGRAGRALKKRRRYLLALPGYRAQERHWLRLAAETKEVHVLTLEDFSVPFELQRWIRKWP